MKEIFTDFRKFKLAAQQQAFLEHLGPEPEDIADYPHPMREGRIRPERPPVPLEALLERGRTAVQKSRLDRDHSPYTLYPGEPAQDLTYDPDQPDELDPLYHLYQEPSKDRAERLERLYRIEPETTQGSSSRFPRI